MDLTKIPRGTLVMVYYKDEPKDTPDTYRLHVFLEVAAIKDNYGVTTNITVTLFSYQSRREEEHMLSRIYKIVPFMFQIKCTIVDIETGITYILDRIYIHPRKLNKADSEGLVMLKIPGGKTIKEKFTNLTKKYSLK